MTAQAGNWRLADTGPRPAAENIAIDSALLKAKARLKTPNTLHFLQFSPPAALVGHFQSVGQEIREDFCRLRGIEIQRRLTGGGALYFDSSHLGWEIIGSRSEFAVRPDRLTARICEGVVAGLRQLGIGAAFRPRNDIEVNGKKISGTGGVFEDGAFLFQGTLLVDLDVESMARALRIPAEKLSAKGLASLKERVTSVKDELSYLPSLRQIKNAIAEGFQESLGITFTPGELTPAEMRLVEKYQSRHASKDWVYLVSEPPGEHQILRSWVKADGGLIRAAISVDIKRRRLKYCLISGDFFISPKRTILDLEAVLKDVPLESADELISSFFKEKDPEMMGVAAADFQAAVAAAIEKMNLAEFGIPLDEANSLFTVNGSFAEAAGGCSLLLLPYCAKLPECDFRTVDGCDMCGKCGVGDAYAMAAARGLDVISIHNYEHLQDTLAICRKSGVGAFIGCCCEAFFVKHQEVFREAGMPAVLIDIENDTCYQMKSEEEAYEGKFENQTELNLNLLGKVLENVGVKSR